VAEVGFADVIGEGALVDAAEYDTAEVFEVVAAAEAEAPIQVVDLEEVRIVTVADAPVVASMNLDRDEQMYSAGYYSY
jgi:anti-sigma factor RsiW